MKVILTQDVEALGRKGEVVQVKDGYGRNFLIPRGLALVANRSNVRRFQEEARQQARKLEQARQDAAATAARLSELEVVIQKPVGEEERIFGTVTTQDLVEALGLQGIEVDRRKVSLDQDIRSLGSYTATVRLHPEHVARVKVRVVPETADEAA